MKYGYWNELWQARHLFILLVQRNISLRYKQALLGTLWSVIKPLLIIAIFTVVFTYIARAGSPGGTPYFLLVATALIPWNFFSAGITEASTSLLSHHSLISKVYIPRLLFPLAAVATNLVECIVAFTIIIVFALFYDIIPSQSILAFPLLLLLLTIITAGVGTFLSAVQVRYRDVGHFLPVALQAGILISPVGFASTLVPERWQFIFFLNPLAGLFEGFRWSILHTQLHFSLPITLTSLFTGLVCCIAGIAYFRKNEGTIADYL